VNELELPIAVMVLCRTFHSGAGQITYTVYVPQPFYDLVCLERGSDVSDVSARKQTGHILVPKTHWK
jgi:hypothetical protein